jgi:hypothetical protein
VEIGERPDLPSGEWAVAWGNRFERIEVRSMFDRSR